MSKKKEIVVMKNVEVYEEIFEEVWENEKFSYITISNLNIFMKY